MLQAFVVSFADSLIILLATGITTRLNQFNDLLEKLINEQQNHVEAATMWRKMRSHYIRIINLMRRADSHIHLLSFICIGHNSLMFAFRVFKAFKPNRFNVLSHVHFYFVLIILIIQLVATLFTCANMNRSALKPLELLRNVPSKYWSNDVRHLARSPFEIITSFFSISS
jgi:hypothetical protein